MTLARSKSTLLFVMNFVATTIMLTGCADQGVGPANPTFGKFYIYDSSPPQKLIALDIPTFAIDSVPGISPARFVAAPDADLIYATCEYGVRLLVPPDMIPIDSMPLNFIGYLAISYDGSLLCSYGDNIEIVNLRARQSVFFDTTAARSCTFSRNRGVLWGLTSRGLMRVDLAHSFEMSFRTIPFGTAKMVRPSVDDKYLYFSTKFQSENGMFCVYDYTRDKFVFCDTITPARGDLAVDPRGRYVLYTSPGDPISGAPAREFYVYSVRENRRALSVSTMDIVPDTGYYNDYVAVGPLAIDRIGQYAVLGGYFNNHYLIFDLDQMRIVDWGMTRHQSYFGSISDIFTNGNY